MSETDAVYRLREFATGVEKPIAFDNPWCDGDDGNSWFVWSESNFSCDCNRMLYFTNWECDDDAVQCSEGRFLLRVTAVDDGRILYDEWERVR